MWRSEFISQISSLLWHLASSWLQITCIEIFSLFLSPSLVLKLVPWKYPLSSLHSSSSCSNREIIFVFQSWCLTETRLLTFSSVITLFKFLSCSAILSLPVEVLNHILVASCVCIVNSAVLCLSRSVVAAGAGRAVSKQNGDILQSLRPFYGWISKGIFG